MESAIPEHLRSARTRHRRVPDDYVPPYPSFVARHKPTVQRVVMAYFGVQFRGPPPEAAEQAINWIGSCLQSTVPVIGTGRAMSTKPVSPMS
jgi:aldoxime dehydratase